MLKENKEKLENFIKNCGNYNQKEVKKLIDKLISTGSLMVFWSNPNCELLDNNMYNLKGSVIISLNEDEELEFEYDSSCQLISECIRDDFNNQILSMQDVEDAPWEDYTDDDEYEDGVFDWTHLVDSIE